jgi:hypothetical protein
MEKLISSRKFTPAEETELINNLKSRFEKNMQRHSRISWDIVQIRIEDKPEKIRSLFQMGESGGEPDAVIFNKDTDEIHFYRLFSREYKRQKKSLLRQ